MIGATETSRGYLWQNLAQEIYDMFYQPHPFVVLCSKVPDVGWTSWHIEGELGNMSGIRKSLRRRREEKSTSCVKELRQNRKRSGECIDCGLPRVVKSKSYCEKHREIDRLRAEKKRKKLLTAKTKIVRIVES